jgi:hypothetical protein
MAKKAEPDLVEQTRKARGAAEARVKEHEEEILDVRARLAESIRRGEEARRQAIETRSRREEALAEGGAAPAADSLRREEAAFGTVYETERTRTAGLERRLAELQTGTREIVLEALLAVAWEKKVAASAALARLDVADRDSIDVPEVEAYVRLAREAYGAHHDLMAAGDRSLGTPSWGARFDLEQRNLLALAPSLSPGAVRPPAPSDWEWLVKLHAQTIPAGA